MTCKISSHGAVCGDKATVLLDGRIPVCKEHATRYYRAGKDVVLKDGDSKQSK